MIGKKIILEINTLQKKIWFNNLPKKVLYQKSQDFSKSKFLWSHKNNKKIPKNLISVTAWLLKGHLLQLPIFVRSYIIEKDGEGDFFTWG